MKLTKVDGGDLLLVEGGSLLLVEAAEFDPPNLQLSLDGATVSVTYDPSPMVPE